MELWDIKHPWFSEMEENWTKYRLTYLGGQTFIQTYLKQFSKRETSEDFDTRKSVTYCPSFAAATINDVKNSIYQRMPEISRVDGNITYQTAIAGKDGGVNLKGASMNNFIGQELLPELLIMGRVGCFVDMPPIEGNTLAAIQGKRPYLYLYTAEQIPSWQTYCVNGEEILTSLLLKETVDIEDEETGLIVGNEPRARLLRLLPNGQGVSVEIFKQEYDPATNKMNTIQLGDTIILQGLKRIPFVISNITHSLLKDAANYQIALLNMESADISYILRANFPFYYEYYDPRMQSAYIPTGPNSDTENAQQVLARQQEISVGPMHGRRVPVGAGEPGFIHPSSEPLKASMEKQHQMKDDIRKLINLALGSVAPKFASAESKQMDDRGLEAGLSYIGLELERVERLIGEIWAGYVQGAVPSIKYPRKYSLKTDSDRREEAKQYGELMGKAPSRTYAKEVCKQLTRVLLEQKISDDTLAKIDEEIDKAEYLTSDANDITKDVTAGLVDKVTASNARGYDGAKVVPIAEKEHAERLRILAESQTPGIGPKDAAARGLDKGGQLDNDAKDEKTKYQKDPDSKEVPTEDNTRGENKS
jgi:hypothetical protein